MSKNFEVPVSTTSTRFLSNGRFKVNIGSIASYTHITFANNRLPPVVIGRSPLMVDVSGMESLDVERSDGSTVKMSYIHIDEQFKIGKAGDFRRYGMALTESQGPAMGYVGEIGIGPQPVSGGKDEDSYQKMSFIMYPDRRLGKLNILFSPDIKQYKKRLEDDICLNGLAQYPALENSLGNLKYALSGVIELDVDTRSGESIFQFESIHNYIELPVDIHATFLRTLLSTGGFTVVTPWKPHQSEYILNNCNRNKWGYLSESVVKLPGIEYRIGETGVRVSAAQYLYWPKYMTNPNQCVLMVRPQKNPGKPLITGTPFLRSCLFGVDRHDTTGEPAILLCNA